MKQKYLINEIVYFYPANQLLESASEDKKSVSLNVPASRCLKLLLDKKGEIVTKHDFSQGVWESRGQYTSINALYQNISLIRKALREVGISQDVIHTIPREGFSFLGTAILQEEEESIVDNSINSEPVTKEKSLPELSVSYNMDVINHIYSVQDVYSQKIHKDTGKDSFLKQKMNPSLRTIVFNGIDSTYQHKWRAISVALLLALLLYAPYYYTLIQDNRNFFSNYRQIGVINNCTIMKSVNDKLRQKEEYLSIFTEKNIHCEPEKKVYIAMDTRATKVFMHICDKNTNNTASCYSTFFIER
ncbi:TPA: winged helix-turn-helix domain-containing protein [Citrobacter amalonaticus]|uniref:Winged helix-turn-helix domain-containing protein n=1 Tax=Citrobacter amalonaticus TaxID=35703 RepID=A0A9C7QK98_CITAM|nr:winged helix-turn-helix domain-containing protein [Citrobacter amalonaticus]